MRKLNIKNTALIIGPVLFILFALLRPLQADEWINRMAGIVLWMAVWWLTECVHLAVTSLLPLVLIPVCGIAGIKDVAKEYGDSIIFLFLGGFLISIAIEKWDLHKRIARNILKITGSSINGVLAGIMLSAFFISNWISNTATALILFGVVMALYKELESILRKEYHHWLGISLMLGMAYAASIGGMATPVGTPPNMYFFKIYPKLIGEDVHLSFFEWIKLFFPLSFWILTGCYFIIKILFLRKINVQNLILKNFELHKKYKITYEEKVVILVFLLCVILWLFREGIAISRLSVKGWKYFFAHPEYIDDSVVAIAGAVLLFIIPSKKNKGESILVWEDVKRLKYEILLLFGGGFALAFGFEKSGLINYMVEQLAVVKHLPVLLVILLISVIVTLISEFASNIASIQLALPVIAAMTTHFPNEYRMALIMPCVLSASVGFMLPVATAPNTIAFGSGIIPIREMLKAGFWLDLFSIFSISLYCYFVL